MPPSNDTAQPPRRPQVHCSAAVWASAVDRLGVVARAGGEDELTASSLGLQSLKGVMEKVRVRRGAAWAVRVCNGQ